MFIGEYRFDGARAAFVKKYSSSRCPCVQLVPNLLIHISSVNIILQEIFPIFNRANAMKSANLLKYAIRLYQVSIKGLLLGLEHDYTLYKTYFAAMGGLANAYLDLEDFTKGLEIYNAILVLHEKKIGKEHANTMLACHNLGTCHKVKGGVEKGEKRQ